MSTFLIIFNIIFIAFLVLWIPLIVTGIYRLRKYGAKPGGILMTVFGGLWGMGALTFGGLFLMVYLQYQAYSVPPFDPSTYEGPLGKVKFPFSSEIYLSAMDSNGKYISSGRDGDYVELPVEKYSISSCRFTKNDVYGNPWILKVYPYPKIYF
jgi:hypothetical protein